MSATARTSPSERAWTLQNIWSQVATRLKTRLQQARRRILALTVLGAVLSAAAVVAGLDSPAGKTLAALGGGAVGRGASFARVRARTPYSSWTRARSVAEGLKSEAYLYMAGVGDYAGPNRARVLDERVDALARRRR